MIIELNPVGDRTAGMLQGFKAMAVQAWLLERADHALNYPVLLWGVRRDELLPQTITAHQGRVVSARKDQAVVASKQERLRHPSERAEAGDQCMFRKLPQTVDT